MTKLHLFACTFLPISSVPVHLQGTHLVTQLLGVGKVLAGKGSPQSLRRNWALGKVGFLAMMENEAFWHPPEVLGGIVVVMRGAGHSCAPFYSSGSGEVQLNYIMMKQSTKGNALLSQGSMRSYWKGRAENREGVPWGESFPALVRKPGKDLVSKGTGLLCLLERALR